ncbi:MAG: thiamine pyrophosphate-dependent enzyme [Candidatus Paceibacterota bacterium]
MNKPVILAGAGVFGAEREFYSFINRVQAPVLLTWKAMGLLSDDHPLYCGRPGAIGQYASNRILQECDFLLVLGAKMDKDQTAYQLDKIAPNVIMKNVVDIDETELQKYDDTWSIHPCAVKTFLELFETPEKWIHYSHDWLSYCKSLNVNYPVVNPEWWEQEHVNYYCFLEELSNLAKSSDIIAPECSNAAPPLFQSWKVKTGQRFPYAGALGAMGQGIPGAIGAALGTGRRVLCPVGDGGFMLNVQELEVIHRLQLPIKLFVIDNGGYGAIMNTQRSYFPGRFVGCNGESGLTLPDIESVCEAFKMDTWKISRNSHIKGVLEHVMGNNHPEVVIVKIPNDFQFEHRVKRIVVNGVPTSGKFEDID